MKDLLLTQLSIVGKVCKVPLRILSQTSNFLDRSSWRWSYNKASDRPPRKAGDEDTERPRYAEKVPLVIR